MKTPFKSHLPSKLYLVAYLIDGKWQRDGEWFASAAACIDQGCSNLEKLGSWTAFQVIRLDKNGLKVLHEVARDECDEKV